MTPPDEDISLPTNALCWTWCWVWADGCCCCCCGCCCWSGGGWLVVCDITITSWIVVSLAVLTTMVLPLPPAATLFVDGRPLVNVRMVGDDSSGVNVIDWGDADDSLDAATLTMFFVLNSSLWNLLVNCNECCLGEEKKTPTTRNTGTISNEGSVKHAPTCTTSILCLFLFLFETKYPDRNETVKHVVLLLSLCRLFFSFTTDGKHSNTHTQTLFELILFSRLRECPNFFFFLSLSNIIYFCFFFDPTISLLKSINTYTHRMCCREYVNG